MIPKVLIATQILCAGDPDGETKTLNHLGVFAKYWQPGAVKTRLAAVIGNENAASLYREFVLQTLIRQAEVGDLRSIWVWPGGSRREFQNIASNSWSLQDHWTLGDQARGDLGQKMLDFFCQTIASDKPADGENGSSAAGANASSVLIGSDTPNLPGEIVDEAFHLLEGHEVVLGPSSDGGYYLIGMNRLTPQVFSEIQWSSPQVLSHTIAKLDQLEVTWAQLPEWNDIDEFDDLKKLERQLEMQLGESANAPQIQSKHDLAKHDLPKHDLPKLDLPKLDLLDQDLLAAIRQYGKPMP